MRTVVLAVVACGQTSPPVSAPIEPPTTRAYQLPLQPIAPPWTLVCGGTIEATRTTSYRFSPDAIEPVAFGPLIADRPRSGRARTRMQLEEVLDRKGRAIAGCWKWASARGAGPTVVDLAFTVHPLGTTSGLAVSGRASELVACLQDMLRDLEPLDPSPRTTQMAARLEFGLAEEPRWPAPPKRPVLPPPPPRERTCVAAVANIVDRVASPIAFTVDDSDPVRMPNTATVRYCPNRPTNSTTKPIVRTAFRANRGAFQRCYADAHARDPQLAGTATIHAVFDRAGLTTNVYVDGAGDDAFRGCIAIAARELWLPAPGDRTITVTYPLALARPAAPPENREPATLLDAGDTTAAIAAWTRLLATTRDPLAACQARVGIVRALIARAPWEDDPRTLAGLRELSAFVTTARGSVAYRCLAPIAAQLRELALESSWRDSGRWESLERIEAILPLARVLDRHRARLAAQTPRPALPGATPEPRWYLLLRVQRAQQLLGGDHHAEAVEELTRLSTDDDPEVGRTARLALMPVEASHVLVDHGC